MLGEGPSGTQFAPAGRSSQTEVKEQHDQVKGDALLGEILDACPHPAAVLNGERQIVFCNRSLKGLVDGAGEEQVWGQRPGEVLGCVHAQESAGGCGTTEFCQVCGAVLAILEGQHGRPAVKECRIVRPWDKDLDALDLRVTVAPATVGEHFVVCAVEDISHEKRRRALERIFFHDVLNAAWSLQACAQLAARAAADTPAAEIIRRLQGNAARLVSEIRGQQLLLAAENRDLAARPQPTRSRYILDETIDQFRELPVSAERTIRVAEDFVDVPLVTDETLLGRVLGNMLRNALEASEAGETVEVGCRDLGERAEFWVHNPAVMPRQVQLQIFQRSFSTKGPGRGLGTYGMRLLAERYLNAEVGFTSREGEGTRFYVRVPKR